MDSKASQECSEATDPWKEDLNARKDEVHFTNLSTDRKISLRHGNIFQKEEKNFRRTGEI